MHYHLVAEQIKVFRNQHGQLPPTPNARVLGPMHIPSGQKGDIVALHGILEDTRDYRALRVQGTTLMLAGERRATFWSKSETSFLPCLGRAMCPFALC